MTGRGDQTEAYTDDLPPGIPGTTPILPGPATDGRGARYRVVEIIGEGGCGRVYGVEDRDLARTVALKVARGSAGSDDGMADLLAEARITAALDHPGVVPIYDIGRTATGEPWFTMRRIGGRPLADLCGDTAGAASINDRLTILLKLCDVLAAAHHQGVLHCDIKPGNIMLGDFGEVQLVDWGIAASLAHGSATTDSRGTPAYMSPEQASGKPLTVRSDIYAFGATMFDLFTGRPPILADGSDAFWERKHRGEFDPPSESERSRVPRKLLAIALKALAADPAGRYAEIPDLADDLRRFQAGQSVSACRDSFEERAGRWWRTNRRRVGITAAAMALAIGAGAYLYGERLKGIATWGSARWAPGFAGGRLQGEWTLVRGSLRQDGDGVVTTDDNETILILNRRMTGPSALEFTGRMLPEGGACDLSVMWYPEVVLGAGGIPDLERMKGAWTFQAGAFDNLYCGITGPRAEGQAIRYRSLEMGRDYRIRAEIDERRLALFIDGELVCEHTTVLPFASGHFAFYGYHKGKRFSDVRVYAKGVPERLAPTAIGDAFADKGRWAEAAEQYARVAESLAGRPVAEEARYRQGVCHLQVEDVAGAERVWQPLLVSPAFALRVRARLLEQRARGEPAPLIGEMRELCRQARSGEDRLLVVQAWRSGARTLIDQGASNADRDAWLVLRDTHLADEDTTQADAAALLLHMRRPREILSRFPGQRWICADALLQLGEYGRVLRDYGDLVAQRHIALVQLGDYVGALADCGPAPRNQASVWLDFGRSQELLANRDAIIPQILRCALLDIDRPAEVLPGATGAERARALLMLGRLDEAEAVGSRFHQAVLLMLAGRGAEAERRWPGDAMIVARARAVRALDRLQADGRIAATALDPPVATIWDLGDPFATWQHLLVPFIREMQGESGAFDGACRRVQTELRRSFRQVVWHDAAYLAGTIDRPAFLAQPMRVRLERRLLMLDGIRAERAGRRGEALRCYGAWAGPCPLDNDPVITAFVRWRLAALR